MVDQQRNVNYGRSILNKNILITGEQIVFETRPLLWTGLFFPWLLLILGLIITVVPLFELIVGVSDSIFPEVIRWFGEGIMLIGGLIMVKRILEWQHTIYVLTNKRVLRQKGILGRSYVDCGLNKIQNLYIDISAFGRMLGYGSVRIAAAGTAGIEIEWEGVRDPLGVQRQLNEAIERYFNRDERSGNNSV